MENENKPTEEKPNEPTQEAPVTHEQLSEAADVALSERPEDAPPEPEKPAETPPEKPTEPPKEAELPKEPEKPSTEQPPAKPESELPTEPTDPAERSQLGRKVKALSAQLDSALTLLQEIRDRKPEPAPTQAQPQNANEVESVDDELPTEPEEFDKRVLKLVEQRDKTKADEDKTAEDNNKVYERDFNASFVAEGTDYEEGQLEEIYSIMFNDKESINVRHTGDARRDGKIAFGLAENRYLRMKHAKPANETTNRDPLEGRPASEGPTGLDTGSRNTSSNRAKDVKLSPEAKELARHYGLTDEQAAKQIEEAGESLPSGAQRVS